VIETPLGDLMAIPGVFFGGWIVDGPGGPGARAGGRLAAVRARRGKASGYGGWRGRRKTGGQPRLRVILIGVCPLTDSRFGYLFEFRLGFRMLWWATGLHRGGTYVVGARLQFGKDAVKD